MKILVLGASQGTGALCVRSALAKGHSVSAFSRTPAKLDVTHPALTKVASDFFSRGMKYCIDAMKEQGLQRLVVLSAHGVGETQPAASWFQRTFLIGGLLTGSSAITTFRSA